MEVFHRREELLLPVVATVVLLAVGIAALISTWAALLLGAVGLGAIWGTLVLGRRRSAHGREVVRPAQATIDEFQAPDARDEARELLEALDEPVLATDPEGRVVVANTSAAALLGVGAARLAGRPVEEVFTQEEVLRLYERARHGAAGRGEVRVPTAGGFRVWDVSAGPRPGGGVVMSLRDVTERARAMQVRTDFAANASHELRTPIAAMRVALDTLEGLGEGEDPALRARFMGMLARNIERLEALVRDLLDLSRLESPDAAVKREAVDVEGVMSDLRPLYERVLRDRSLSLRVDVQGGAGTLLTDRNLLLLILGNLIDNATKYAFEGTEVVVSFRRIEGAAQRPGGVEISVADKGIGIPLDQQQRIFERFYQVDSARSVGSPDRGTGLGLSIVKHAVRRLGGAIRVESVWQQGTRMVVELPESAAEAGNSAPVEGSSPSGNPDLLV